MWQFPCTTIDDKDKDNSRAPREAMLAHLASLGIEGTLKRVGETVYLFSHIRQSMVVFSLVVDPQSGVLIPTPDAPATQWVACDDLDKVAIPTVSWRAFHQWRPPKDTPRTAQHTDKQSGTSRKRARKNDSAEQPSILAAFKFQPKSKEEPP
mmetsp:Transcript_51103/g.111138  ORF Transcript_51103/g.111138 Transcript_51103/m.111138 type:complete len:152 (+) Transcript_51103:77-532(+)